MQQPYAPPAGPPTPDSRPARWSRLAWPVVLGAFLLAGSMFLAGHMLRSSSHADGGSVGKSAGSGERGGSAIAYVDVEGGVSHLYPVANGRVTGLPVKEGREVKKGDLLLQVDDTLAKIQLTEAQIAVEAARKHLEQAQDEVTQQARRVEAQQAAVQVMRLKQESARARYEQVKRYIDKKISGSPEDLTVADKAVKEAGAAIAAEEAKLALVRSARPQTLVALARLDLDARQEQVRKAEHALTQCAVRAPTDGLLLRKLVSVGDVLGPNPRGPALIFLPAGPLIIRAEVEQEFAGVFDDTQKKGEPVRISDEVTGKLAITGKIQRVSRWIAQRRSVLPEPRQFNDIRTLEVIVKPDTEAGLRIGQRVRVELGRRPGS